MRRDVLEIFLVDLLVFLALEHYTHGTVNRQILFEACVSHRLGFYIPVLTQYPSDPYHLITTGGEGQFDWKKPVGFWYNGQFISDYNFNGQGSCYPFSFWRLYQHQPHLAGEDFDRDLTLKNIDFGTYVR